MHNARNMCTMNNVPTICAVTIINSASKFGNRTIVIYLDCVSMMMMMPIWIWIDVFTHIQKPRTTHRIQFSATIHTEMLDRNLIFIYLLLGSVENEHWPSIDMEWLMQNLIQSENIRCHTSKHSAHINCNMQSITTFTRKTNE